MAAAHDDRRVAPPADVADRLGGRGGEGAGRETLARFDDVDEMMADPREGVGARLVGADVEAPVDRKRVGGDDLPTESFSDLETESALPGCGRADHEQKRLGVCGSLAHNNRIRQRPRG